MSPGATGSQEYVVLPSVGSIRAISLWIYIQPQSAQDDAYPWKYLLDARTGLGHGWISTVGNSPQTSVGSNWHRAILHDMDTGARTDISGNGLPGLELPGGKWQHIYLAARSNFVDDVHLLGRFQASTGGMEDLAASLVSATLWTRELTDVEVDDLA